MPSEKTAHLSVDDESLTNTQRKLLRRDTLNRMLKNRPKRDELVERNIIPGNYDDYVHALVFKYLLFPIYPAHQHVDRHY